MTEEQLEKKYLKTLIREIDLAIHATNERLQSQSNEIQYLNNHMQEYKTDMDHLEKNAMREAISNTSRLGEHAMDKSKRLDRLRNVPFFGRIDFSAKGSNKSLPIYIGVHHFQGGENNANLVYDWRAPISSMFYDFELGDAYYDTINDRIEGQISLKRQFRIRNSEMEYMIDSALTIQDEVLQRELNQASSSKMKNIVATIQREQNAIIRNENARHLIIQGVAGSGKTSIALHRIAFLLYKFKETIASTDILIISPNKVFASYISNVLPELGEETVEETSMEEIANGIFIYQIKFQSFFDQVSELLEKHDLKLTERIRYKSSVLFLKKMDEYVLWLENEGFKPIDVVVARKPIPAWFIKEMFDKHNRKPLLNRFNAVVEEIVSNVKVFYQYDIQNKERTDLHATIRKMFVSYSLTVLYKEFYNWMEKPEMLKIRKGNVYEYSDVYPLIYLKMKLQGLQPFNKVKHLVVDEMQDYSAVQFKILSTLFPCKKTILGDINQSVNPFSASNVETIQDVFPDAECMTMLKSYRSTYEITQFTKRISQNIEVEALERHGDEPKITTFKTELEEYQHLSSLIDAFKISGLNSLGIICKTQSQADLLYKTFYERHVIRLLNAGSVSFGGGIVISTAHLAKGLEFDCVIVPHCNKHIYHTDTDRQMLYVACTRAMHSLELTASGKLTELIG